MLLCIVPGFVTDITVEPTMSTNTEDPIILIDPFSGQPENRSVPMAAKSTEGNGSLSPPIIGLYN